MDKKKIAGFEDPDSPLIVVFDGVCNFCNWAVNFIIKRDKAGIFKFAPSQGIAGTAILAKYQINNIGNNSIILIEDGNHLIKSDAVLEIFKYLEGGWKYLRVLKIFPRKFRDWGYSVFAKHRYSLFGKRDACMIPPDHAKERFLD